jgi:NSS family neurotransmitter:Na+ symporter
LGSFTEGGVVAAGRETWNSRAAFVMAAIGSAIGLGNIWRFPYIAYENGGGTFLVVYIICLIFAGIPLLMLEFSLGHMFHQAAPGAFARIHPRLQWFGWFAAGVGFVICVYYTVIMGWCMNYSYEALRMGWERHAELSVDTTLAICPTTLQDRQVLTPVPDSLVGRAYTSPSGAAATIVDEPTTVISWHSGLYAFPRRAQAQAFLRSPLPAAASLAESAMPDGILEGTPDSLQGIAYISPYASPSLPAQTWVTSRVATMLIAYGGKIYAFPTIRDATPFTGSTEDFFYNRFLGLPSRPWDLGSFRWELFIGFALSWIWIIACVWKGTKSVGKIVFYTVSIPYALILVFMVRGLSLPGASEGLSYYLTPDWARLADPGIWLAAITQIFFSLSVGFAIMIAYGSYLPGKTNIASNAFIVGFADTLLAFIGGIAVFSALGYQAQQMGVPVPEVVTSGPGLTFVTYPLIISSLPAAPLFGFLFYVMLLALAVDSAFSLVEAVTASVRDKWGFSHRRANLTVGGLAFLFGLPMLFGAGLYILDITDYFMNFFGLSLVVIGETVIVGWGMGADRMRKHINQNSSFAVGGWWNVCIRWLLPGSIVWMLYSEVKARAASAYGSFGLRSHEFIFGWLIMILLPIVSDILANSQGKKEEKARG